MKPALLSSLFGALACILSVRGHLYGDLASDSELLEHASHGDLPVQGPSLVAPPPLEIEPLVISGPPENRVNLVFFADGYTPAERAKFFSDSLFLAQDMTLNQTFNTVRPLLNFYAAYTPSNQSGVGTNGRALDTAFGLYRDGTQLRGVYCSKPTIIRDACSSLGNLCNYPILLGNSPFYGGLGGNPTIVTASPFNGAVVLRHELGHSIIRVGEEYNGGSSYFGVNSQRAATNPVSWAHWLTNPSAPVRAERSVMSLQGYVWTLLNSTRSWTTTFRSPGTYSRYHFKYSISGIPSASDLTVRLDGIDLGWVPQPGIGDDRWHYNYFGSSKLAAGQHTLEFVLRNPALVGKAQLCNIEILEFGSQSEFVSTPGHYSLYPTFDSSNRTTYRPTNDDCLMRVMTASNFCSVCKEDLWRRLLTGIDLIDSVTEACSSAGNKTLEAKLVPVGQFRLPDNQVNVDESVTIRWLKNGVVVPRFANAAKIDIGRGTAAVGNWTVEVAFETEEVRQDPQGRLSAREVHPVTVFNC